MPKSGHYNPQKEETKRLWYTFRNYIIHLEFHYSLANRSNTSYKNKMIHKWLWWFIEMKSWAWRPSLWLKDSYSSPNSHFLQLYEGEGRAVDFVIPKLLSTTKNFNGNSNKVKSLSHVQLFRLLGPWNSPDKNTGVGCHFLLQGIFPTQGLNLGLLHCRQTHYHLSYQGSPI